MTFAIETYSTRKVFFTSDTHFFHENVMRYCNRPFESVEEMNEAIISNLCYSGEVRGQWQLFGHVHSGEKELDRERLNCLFPTKNDVGVDANAFTPVSFDQIKAVFESRQKG